MEKGRQRWVNFERESRVSFEPDWTTRSPGRCPVGIRFTAIRAERYVTSKSLSVLSPIGDGLASQEWLRDSDHATVIAKAQAPRAVTLAYRAEAGTWSRARFPHSEFQIP